MLASVGTLYLAACQGGREAQYLNDSATSPRNAEVFEGPVARADCGPGSMPETAIQGRVSMEDRLSGRSQQGYSCNLELVGQHQGKGASWQHALHW